MSCFAHGLSILRAELGRIRRQRCLSAASAHRERVQANGVLRIPLFSQCRIETDILYFPLNYTSSEIHFEQFEILTSSLTCHYIS